MLEFALLAPWYAFLFVGAYDFGFYSYGLIATQNAARVAAMYCSASTTRAANCDATYEACGYVLDQLRDMPNVGSAMTGPCTAPVVVTTSMITGPDGASAAQVTVAYTTPKLIPIPGVLLGGVTITRTSVMRVLG